MTWNELQQAVADWSAQTGIDPGDYRVGVGLRVLRVPVDRVTLVSADAEMYLETQP